MRHRRSHDICKEEFALAVLAATNKLDVSIDKLFQLCGFKGGDKTYYSMLSNGRIDKGSAKKLKQYIDLSNVIVKKK